MDAAEPLFRPCATRPLFLVLLVALCFFASSNSPVASAADSCSNGLSLGNLVPFNTTGLACFQAWPSQDFILRFGKASNSSSAWSFVLSAPDNGGYISIGFSPTGRMVGSSAVAGWAGSKSKARQYYLGGTSSSACPPDQGDLALASSPTVASKGSRLYLAFQLTGQPLADVVYAVGPSGTVPGSNGLLPRHQDMASGSISLSGGGSGGGSPATGGGGGDGDGDDDGGEGNGKTKSKPSGEGSGEDDDGEEGKRQTSSSSVTSNGGLSSKRRHGVLAVVSWGALVPIGAALARFLEHRDPLWFYAHAAAQGVGSVVGAVAVAAGFRLHDADEGSVAAHKAVGVVALVCACLQLTAALARPARETKARRYWNWWHHGVGRAAVVLGVVNVLYGMSVAGEREEWSYVYGVLVGVFLVACLVLEEWRRRQ
ncbi:hypothetical protein PR202_ga08654 [Eleusine coracana subsp. coracana]|uniref:Cytochrome b561 and DOMON domain-containing protein n=1 Tax=Eleusine coracana subsp. coracana TaxID=191504 RepID=A0AAV5C343_ELECO|nr:hypothetical protein QOZ80_1BG0092780 [Eleusine coracana subsp. coracana]GJM92213.1 hypothetical protein PR202_ga08654 [Eleusine coracana subsp. coracana]